MLTFAGAREDLARIVASLPGGLWPSDADTAVLLPLALEASSTPDMLPLTHKDKPNWGSGLGGDHADFWMPDTRAAYERMIEAHRGQLVRPHCYCTACMRMDVTMGTFGPGVDRAQGWPRFRRWRGG